MTAPKIGSLTLERLHEVLHYDPETGIFTWRIRMSTGRTTGDAAGAQATDGYVRIQVDKISYTASRLAWFYMTGAWPTTQIDHEDRDRANNRWLNLRLATHKQNQENKSSWAASGARGVIWFKGKWQAAIKHNHQNYYLGRFSELNDAVAARRAAEQRLFTHHREYV